MYKADRQKAEQLYELYEKKMYKMAYSFLLDKEQEALEEGKLFYMEESDSGNPVYNGVYLKAGETKTCQAVFMADAENVDKYFLVINHEDIMGDYLYLANKNQQFIDIRKQGE